MNQRTCAAETCLLSSALLLVPWEKENRKDIQTGRSCITNEKNPEQKRSEHRFEILAPRFYRREKCTGSEGKRVQVAAAIARETTRSYFAITRCQHAFYQIYPAI